MLQSTPEKRLSRILFLSLEKPHRLMFQKIQQELQKIPPREAFEFTILDVAPLNKDLPFFCKIFDKERIYRVENLIRKHRPDILIVANDHGINAAFIKICKLFHIPTVAVQDGVLSETKRKDFLRILQLRNYLFWRLLASLSNNSLVARLSVLSGWRVRVLDWGLGGADKIAVMGDFYRRLFLFRGIPTSKILVTGYPLLDEIPSRASTFEKYPVFKELKLNLNKKLAVLITQPFVNDGIWDSAVRENLVKSIAKFSEQLTDVQFVIKVHPRESLDDYEKIVGKRIRMFKEVDLNDLLLASDVVLTVNSTVGLWALAYKKPLVVFDYHLSIPDIFYKDAAIEVKDFGDLPAVVTNAINESNDKKSVSNKSESFLRDHVYRLDGKASQRIAQLIHVMVNHTET